MAVTRRPNVIQHTAAGDSSTETVLVKRLVWNGSTAAADELTMKNSDGTVLLSLKAGANVGHLQLEYPFGDVMVKGLETDVIDAGTVEYILG